MRIRRIRKMFAYLDGLCVNVRRIVDLNETHPLTCKKMRVPCFKLQDMFKALKESVEVPINILEWKTGC